MGSPAPAPCCVQLDRRVEYGRAVAARTRMEIAITALAAAKAEVSVTVGEQHTATVALAEALQAARISAAKLDIVIRYLARIQ